MSMPTFPDKGLNLTREQTFNMLLGSIAMEELALSHIMNAEGEKLQYFLGTLPSSPHTCITPEKLLEVNNSISMLLEQVNQNQLLLKGKLAQVFNIMKCCSLYCNESSCNDCHHSNSTCILTAPQGIRWKKNCCLIWKPVDSNNVSCCWNPQAPEMVRLPKDLSVMLYYSFLLSPEKSGNIAVTLNLLNNDTCQQLSSNCLYYCKSGKPVNITGTIFLEPEQLDMCHSPSLFLVLKESSAILQKATLRLTAI